ncbi:MAG: hypothetical protein QG553_504 [Patescibacteria group bacterium]|nr:hypothetical protein [Patescibacteria group bacterium]
MITVPAGEFNSAGFADVEEAVALAKSQGIANARGAVSPDVIWNLYSLGSMIGMGMSDEVPGVIRQNVASMGGVQVQGLDARKTVDPLVRMLKGVEGRITEAAGDDLPNWRPTENLMGVRIVSMFRDAIFLSHSDDYEGLVASVQFVVEGEKTMRAEVNGRWEEAPVLQGDLTLFGCDTFSERPRTLHGFDFTGAFAVAFTLGQDPYYTISGNRPMVEENPQYLL